MQYEKLVLSSACDAVMEIGNAENVYINERAPWSLFKEGGAASEAAPGNLLPLHKFGGKFPVLDASFTCRTSGGITRTELLNATHIPGALFFDIDGQQINN
ncbi:hypothetical protein Leryth_025451 [Lithospermum erythrorhizon]|nr:hypothetical protein Leryth_025451 [Lithospermum erythrorhizon]